MVLRIFILFSVLFLIASLPISINLPSMLYRCSGGDDEYMSRPAFLFQPQLTETPELEPLYFTWNRYYGDKWGNDTLSANSNIREWKKYFGDTIPTADIHYVVYQAKQIELLDVLVKKRFELFQLNPSLKTNRLVQWLIAKPDSEFLTYIIFAKECEPFVTEINYWEPEESLEQNKDTLIVLMNKAQKLYASCHSDFIKLRYGYQAVRLARYANKLEKCEELYNQLILPLSVKSIIRYWALEQKAGAIRKLKRTGESAYLFSIVFDRCRSRQDVAFASFRIPDDSAWNDCIRRCKTKRERIIVYFLRAINPYNSVLDEMKNMYLIDPESNYLKILLSREVNKIEEHWYDGKWYNENRMDKRDKDYLTEFCAFLDFCSTDKRVNNPDLWNLARAHVRFMNNESSEAIAILNELKKSAVNKLVRNSLPAFEITYQVLGLKQLDQNSENIVFNKVLETENSLLQQITVETFKKLLKEKGDTVRAYLCSNDINSLRTALDLSRTEAVIRWWNKPQRTNFDNYLIQNRFSSFFSDNNALIQIKGSILLGQHKLKEAKYVFTPISPDYSWISRADPFSMRITDCRDCDFASGSRGDYDHMKLIDSLLVLENKINTDLKNSARYHYLLGNAYYNITYFGNCAEATMLYRDPGYYFRGDLKKENIPFYLDCSLARSHYEKAMKLAESSGNYEFAAECCFMAAKCEQNEYFVKVPSDCEKKTTKNTYYRTYFAKMKKQYAKTKFYIKAINECKYFKHYVSQ